MTWQPPGVQSGLHNRQTIQPGGFVRPTFHRSRHFDEGCSSIVCHLTGTSQSDGRVPERIPTFAAIPFILPLGFAPELATPETMVSLAGIAFVLRTALFNMTGPLSAAFTMESLHPSERETFIGISALVGSGWRRSPAGTAPASWPMATVASHRDGRVIAPTMDGLGSAAADALHTDEFPARVVMVEPTMESPIRVHATFDVVSDDPMGLTVALNELAGQSG